MNMDNNITEKILEAIENKYNTRRAISLYTGIPADDLDRPIREMCTAGLILRMGTRLDGKSGRSVRVYAPRNIPMAEKKPNKPSKKVAKKIQMERLKELVYNMACQRPVTTEDVSKELPEVSRRTLALILQHMAERGDITRMDKQDGLYVYCKTGVDKSADIMLQYMRTAVAKAVKQRKGDVSKYGYAFAY